VIFIAPLPTQAPLALASYPLHINLTAFYDSNANAIPELTEGIRHIAVGLYESSNGRLLFFGYTNELGMIRFEGIEVSGTVRVEVPYLNYSYHVMDGNADILLRVSAQPFPSGIP
jgi:hypothetical protein